MRVLDGEAIKEIVNFFCVALVVLTSAILIWTFGCLISGFGQSLWVGSSRRLNFNLFFCSCLTLKYTMDCLDTEMNQNCNFTIKVFISIVLSFLGFLFMLPAWSPCSQSEHQHHHLSLRRVFLHYTCLAGVAFIFYLACDMFSPIDNHYPIGHLPVPCRATPQVVVIGIAFAMFVVPCLGFSLVTGSRAIKTSNGKWVLLRKKLHFLLHMMILNIILVVRLRTFPK
jgi:magnesium-transporting ATPase (P-type)